MVSEILGPFAMPWNSSSNKDQQDLVSAVYSLPYLHRLCSALFVCCCSWEFFICPLVATAMVTTATIKAVNAGTFPSLCYQLSLLY
jgi:hypothetical protein